MSSRANWAASSPPDTAAGRPASADSGPQKQTGRISGRLHRAVERNAYLSVTGTLKYFFARLSIVPSAFSSFSA